MRRDFTYPIILVLVGCFIAALIYIALVGLTVRRRPLGVVRVGHAEEFVNGPVYRSDLNLLFRKDARGLYVMSTLCTKDLTPLRIVETEQGKVFVSDYSTSRFDWEGNVLSGPAVAPLPYYDMILDEGTIEGVRDTLYVGIGREVSKDWRFPVGNR